MIDVNNLECHGMLFDLSKLGHPHEIYERWPEFGFELDFMTYNGNGWIDASAKTPELESEEQEDQELELGFFEGTEAYHLCYTIWLYDMNSPLIKSVPEIEKRRIEAAGLSGLIAYQKHWELASKSMNPLVDQMAAAYVKLQNHSRFEAIISLEQFVHNMWEVVRQKIPFNISGMDSDKIIRANEIQSKCAEAAYKNSERLERLKQDFIREQREAFGEIIVEPEFKQKNKLHRMAAKRKAERRERMAKYAEVAPVQQQEAEAEETEQAPVVRKPRIQAAPPALAGSRPELEPPTRGI